MFKVIGADEFVTLRNSDIKFAFFEKGDKYNIAFLPEQKKIIEELISPDIPEIQKSKTALTERRKNHAKP